MTAPGAVAGDVLGIALEEFRTTRSERMVTTLEFDTGDEWEQPTSAYFAGQDEWGVLETWLFTKIRGQLLDIGCGAGRVSLEASTLDQVTRTLGMDSSPGAVRVATERGLEAVVATFPEALALPPVSEASWDTVALFGNNLGLLQQCRSASVGLDALAGVLAPTGQLLLTAGKPEVLPATVREAGVDRWGSSGAFRARLRHRDVAGDWFGYAFFEPQATVGFLAARGWSCEELRETEAQWAAVVRPPP